MAAAARRPAPAREPVAETLYTAYSCLEGPGPYSNIRATDNMCICGIEFA